MNTYVHKNRATSRRSSQRCDVIERLDFQRRDVAERYYFNVATLESNGPTLESNAVTLQRGIFSTSLSSNPTS